MIEITEKCNKIEKKIARIECNTLIRVRRARGEGVGRREQREYTDTRRRRPGERE